DHGGETYDQRQAKPVKNRRIDVPRLRIGAQKISAIPPLCPSRWQFAVEQHELPYVIWVLGCQLRSEYRGAEQNKKRHRGYSSHPRAAKAPHDVAVPEARESRVGGSHG